LSEARRLAYLEALEIPVWLQRGQAQPASPKGLRLGPGSSGLLLVCASQEQPASALANDIVRVLPETPVWAWPELNGGGQPIAAVVEEHLFTTVLLFGEALAEQVLGQAVPERLAQARLLPVPALGNLGEDATVRRQFWRTLCQQGLVSKT
jgi:hypothetical protein